VISSRHRAAGLLRARLYADSESSTTGIVSAAERFCAWQSEAFGCIRVGGHT
jgi:hypothetical protein